MSTTWFDDVDVDTEAYDDGEAVATDGLGDGEDYDEASRETRARRAAAARARRRRALLARENRRRAQMQARARAGDPTRRGSTAPVPPQAAAAIRTLDLQSKVQEDTFRSALAAQAKRMNRADYAAVAGAATNQFIESFDAPDNAFARAALRFAPLLLLSPPKRGTGLESVLKDPRFVGAVAVGGITFLGENRGQFNRAARVDVLSSSELSVGDQDVFVADVFNRRGDLLPSAGVSWRSDDTNVAEIDQTTGKVTAKGPGTAVITVTSDGAVRRVRLRVTPAAGVAAPAPPAAPAKAGQA